MLGLDLSASQRLQTTLSQSQQQSLRVLQMMDGEISVDSAEGRGTTFTVRLPILINREKQSEGHGAQ